MLGCELPVTRSGYTSIMDLHVLGKPALLIPTPGQPEQEYLAQQHGANGHFITQSQEELALASVLGQTLPVQPLSPIKPNQGVVRALQVLSQHRRS